MDNNDQTLPPIETSAPNPTKLSPRFVLKKLWHEHRTYFIAGTLAVALLLSFMVSPPSGKPEDANTNILQSPSITPASDSKSVGSPQITIQATPKLTAAQKPGGTSPTPTQGANSPTNTPAASGQNSPTPTSATSATTGSISGGFYDQQKYVTESDKSKALIPNPDSRFAASAVGPEIGTADSEPTWTISNLKPGKYIVSIDYSSSKYHFVSQGCSNCTTSPSPNGSTAQFQVDLKAGDNLQTYWTFIIN